MIFDENGRLQIPTLEETFKDYETAYAENFGNVYLSHTSALGSDLSITAEMMRRAAENIQNAYFQNDPFSAVGDGLETLAFLRGLQRKRDIKSKLYITLSSTDATEVTVDTTFKNANDELFLLTDSYTFQNGKVTVVAESELAQNISYLNLTCSNAQINIDSIDLKQEGFEVETDESLRARLTQERNDLSLEEQLFQALYALPNVTEVKVISNAKIVQDGLIPPKTTISVVDGGAESQIAQTIFSILSAEKNTDGNITQIVTSSITSNKYEVKFYRPTDIFLTLQIDLVLDVFYKDTELEAIKKSVVDFFNANFKIGSTVIFDSIFLPIQEDFLTKKRFNGVLNVDILLNNQTENLTFNFLEKPILLRDNITLNVSMPNG